MSYGGKMSCAGEKLMMMYGLNPQHLDAIMDAKNQAAMGAVGSKQYGNVFTPSYEGERGRGISGEMYGTSSNPASYAPVNRRSYDIAPARMPGSVVAYGIMVQNNYQQMPEVQENVDARHDMLAEMIAKAQEEARWMSTMQ